MKLIFFIVVFFTTIFANAQSSKFFQKVSTGLIPGIVATTDFSQSSKPFDMGYGLLANVTVVTPKTYHNLMYGFGNNSVKFLTGYFLPKKWDAYVIYSQEISTSGKYLGLGIEKMIKAGDINTFLFFEGGNNFNGTITFTIGVLISIQTPIWKRE
ncbi:hypothetical protein KKA39_01670 [Patescibacteria group bacterium]|nr:hypothetical protein [Patescibacteria group bacterium]MBU1727995.1 hypothetical protein [Patescibacteria group bacterium]